MTDHTTGLEETYAILEEIGKGGGGTVYKAYHKRLKKEVVLKKIHHALKEINARNEADILKNLKSAYLPQVLDFIEDRGEVYTVMEYIDGRSLAQCLKENVRFSEKDTIKWFRQLAEAVRLLHTQNPPIIHGDIKPENVMLTGSGDVCLIDFNVSSIFDGKYSQALGYTPAYAAPEQIAFYRRILQGNAENTERTEPIEASPASLKTEWMPEETVATNLTEPMQGGRRTERAAALTAMQETIDPRTDLYSLGATMYHAISGVRPEKEKKRDIRELSPGTSEPLAFIVMKCLERRPEDRFQSADELFDALNHIPLSTKAYKRLIVRQNGIRIFLLAIMAASFALIFFGLRRVSQENEIAYRDYVEQEKTASLAADGASVEEAYRKAVAISQTRSDAYLEKGLFLYNAGRWDAALSFLLEEAIPYVAEDSGSGSLYQLAGRCYEELENYEAAHEMFRRALQYGSDEGVAYREDAICMALLGNIDEAERLLSAAEAAGLDADGISYTRGEIAAAKGETSTAEQYFLAVTDRTGDAYMQMRAFQKLAQLYREEARTVENCEKRIALLREASSRVEKQYRGMMLEELAQACIDLYTLTDEESDAADAIAVLHQIVQNKTDSFETHQSVAALFLQTGQLDEAETELQRMLELYGDDYRIYLSLAFTEGERQTQKAISGRDYTKFAEYFQKADELYRAQAEKNRSDPTMDALYRAYRQAVDGGWIQEDGE